MARIQYVLRITLCLSLVTMAGVSSSVAQPGKKSAIERSPLLKAPTTPDEMFSAALLMVDLARFDLANQYLDQFLATDPDDQKLIELRDKFGTGDFVKLAAQKELQPASTSLLERLNAAAKKQAEDPQFVDGLINRLMLGTAERDLAIAELRNAGAAVVPEILRKMSEDEMADKQDIFVLTLIRMGNQVIPAMIGALDSPQERIRAAVIDVLGWLEAHESIPYLWFPAFDEDQPEGVRNAARRTLIKLLKGSPNRGTQLSSVVASNELKRLAKLLYRTPDLLPADEQGNVSLWAWDEKEGTIIQRALKPEVAALFLSTRFARQSLSLSPEQPEPQRQYLASLLGLEVLRQGWDKPRLADPGSAMYLGLTAGEETVSQVLSEALEAGRASTAVAALEILGQVGTREQLLNQSGLKSPVIAALNSPDQRVQFAAAVTILKLNPKNGFSNANRVVAILARALTDVQKSRAVVIDADSARASMTSAFLSEVGYDGYMASASRDGFEQAATSTGVEVIAVHVNCQRWDLSQTLSNIRADSRTAAIPLVIYGPATLRAEMARVVARHSPATYVTETSTSRDFLDQVLPFMKSLQSTPLSANERHQQKVAAGYWLATIGSGNLARIFDIAPAEKELTAAVEDPAVATNALIALAGIGTASGQRRLVDIALNSQLNEGVQQTAANQLAYHIQHYGLMLTKDEVAELHSGWKQTQNPAVKSALASVIGSLRPNATIVSERLRQFTTPPAN
jgi:DNA-binding response OmpR family regulator